MLAVGCAVLLLLLLPSPLLSLSRWCMQKRQTRRLTDSGGSEAEDGRKPHFAFSSAVRLTPLRRRRRGRNTRGTGGSQQCCVASVTSRCSTAGSSSSDAGEAATGSGSVGKASRRELQQADGRAAVSS